MAEVAAREVLLDRERRREQVELVEPAPGLADVGRDLVAAPELRLEVGMPVVVDHEARRRERLEPLVDRLGVVGDVVRAALHRREPDALAGDTEENDVRERADEHRVARLEDVVGRLRQLVERRRVRAARGAPERLRLGGVEHVQDEVGLGDVVDADEVVALELLADLGDPLLVGGRGGVAPDRVLPHGAESNRETVSIRCPWQRSGASISRRVLEAAARRRRRSRDERHERGAHSWKRTTWHGVRHPRASGSPIPFRQGHGSAPGGTWGGFARVRLGRRASGRGRARAA